MASSEEQQAILVMWNLLGHGGLAPPKAVQPGAQCDVKNRVAFPGSVFGGPSSNVYHGFCEKWTAATEQQMTVDANGNNKTPQGQLMLRPRVPPQNPLDFMDYSIDLHFKPSTGKKGCVHDCLQAFGQITSGCSNTGSKSRSHQSQHDCLSSLPDQSTWWRFTDRKISLADQQVMSTTGSINVECGVFDYKINARLTTALTLQERQCFASDTFGSHGDIHESWVRNLAIIACEGTSKKAIERDDPSTTVVYAASDKKQPVQFKIYWKEGCLLAPPGGEQMLPNNPLALKDEDKNTCQNLLVDNYKKCNNGGVGGSIQAGCLVFEFKAEHD